jgi:hypothetical protein
MSKLSDFAGTAFFITMIVVGGFFTMVWTSRPGDLFSKPALLSLIHSPDPKPSLSDLEHLGESMTALGHAKTIVNSEPTHTLKDEDFERISEYVRKAFWHAKFVDPQKLDEIYPTWGVHFEYEYREGLKLLLEGLSEEDDLKGYQGQMFLQRWDAWFNENLPKIRALNR